MIFHYRKGQIGLSQFYASALLSCLFLGKLHARGVRTICVTFGIQIFLSLFLYVCACVRVCLCVCVGEGLSQSACLSEEVLSLTCL